MKVTSFDTAVVPADLRLQVFRAGAVEFRVDPSGDPAAFGARWRMLKLGDINLIHSQFSPLHYRREPETIAEDGEDRFTLHYYYSGGETGVIDGRPVRCGPGGAMVWDLMLPLDMRSFDAEGPPEALIVTLPRLMIDEVLPAPSIAGPLAPSPELELAAEQARYILDHAEATPDTAAVFLGRALRDMLAVAMLPAYRASRPLRQPDAPLLQRLVALLDAQLSQTPDVETAAARLGVDSAAVIAVAEQFGGISQLAERRRLLAAYRLLRDPGETETVVEIAHRCGFRSLPQFSRRFRTAFHTSARDLRRFGGGRLPAWAGAYHVERLYGSLIAS